MLELLKALEGWCPVPILRGTRIVRLSEQVLGGFWLNYESLFELGCENVGVFVGGGSSWEFFAERLCVIPTLKIGGNLVVVTSSKAIADSCYLLLAGNSAKKKRPAVYTKGALTLTTPERLSTVTAADLEDRPVLGIGLLDPKCFVHRLRGKDGYGWEPNDRPQHLARFRYRHRVGEWQPPFVLMTEQPARSVSTNELLAPYGLEAWWFVDGRSLQVGPVPEQGPIFTPTLQD